MGLVEDYPDIKDWLEGNSVCLFSNIEDFLGKFGVTNSTVISVAYEYWERFCKGRGEPIPKPKRHYFRTPRSKARLIGIDRLGRRYAVGRSGYRISTKGYERYFRKLASR